MSQPPSLSSSGLPEVQQEEKTFALIAHLSIFIGAIIVPAIIYFIKKDQSPYVAYHAMQALVFQIGVVAFNIVIMFPVSIVLGIITMGLCSWVGCLGFIPIFAAIPFALKANNGEWTGYPGISNIGRPPGV